LGVSSPKSLHVYVGDDLTLTPLWGLGPWGVLAAQPKVPCGCDFYSGMTEYDASHAYVKIESAQDFFD